VAKMLRGAQVVDFSEDQVRLLNFGRVVDTTRLKEEFGYRPRWNTKAAFDDYLRGRGLRPVLDGEKLAVLADQVLTAAKTGQM
jgi:UDP-glucose 4-epimerase